MVSSVRDPDFHRESYELGYREGESNRAADFNCAFSEAFDLPDHVDPSDPSSLVAWVAQEMTKRPTAEAVGR